MTAVDEAGPRTIRKWNTAQVDAWTAFLFDGLIDSEGRILNAVNGKLQATGKPRNVNPDYWRYLGEVNAWATKYPTTDPHLWVPLAKFGVAHDSFTAAGMLATQMNNSLDTDPAIDRVTDAQAEAKAQAAADDWQGGFLSDAFHVVQNVGGVADDLPIVAAPIAATKFGARNLFTFGQMPLQAVQGTMANVTDDMARKDYKSAILHTFASNPVVEAAFIGAENVTGTQFYREGGAEQTNWSQSEGGQIILDLFGQGRAEQFGGPNDPIGIQTPLGNGFTASPEITSWQEAARAHANTLVAAKAATDQQVRHIQTLATMQSEEAAYAYATEQGLEWDPIGQDWLTPALVFTPGRWVAMHFTDPGTTAFNTLSGSIDFGVDLFADPLTYVPGGQIRKGFQALKGGQNIIQAGDRAAVFTSSGTRLLDADAFAGLKANLGETAAIEKITNAGYHVTPESAWRYLNTGKGQAVVQGMVDETDALRVYLRSNRKFTPHLSYLLSKAETPDEVRGLLAPRLGVDVRYANDLQRFMTGLPTTDVGTRIAKATDLHPVKDAWNAHVPGGSFMPAMTADIMDPHDTVDQLLRLSRVTLTNSENNPELLRAFDNLMAVPDDGSKMSAAGRYQSIYGIAGDKVVFDAAGRVILDHSLTKDAIADIGEQGLLDRLEPGAYIDTHGQDGVLKVLADLLVTEKGMEPRLATKLLRAWAEDDALYRKYAEDGEGGLMFPPWSDGRTLAGEPSLESDLLSRTIVLPNADAIRKHTARWGHITDKMQQSEREGVAKAGEWTQALDDLATVAMYRWKQATLMAAGLRFPVYTFRATADTMATIGMSGGASVLHRPGDLLGLVITSAVRKAMKADKDTGRVKLARKLHDNPLVRMAWRDDLVTDTQGNTWDEAIRKIIEGDPGFHDDFYRSQNISVGNRGAKGMDVLYQEQADKYALRNLDDPTHAADYAKGMVDQLYRLSGSDTVRKLASLDTNIEDITDEVMEWFLNTPGSGYDVLSTMSKRAAEFMTTRDGVRKVLDNARMELRAITHDDPDLLAVVARGGTLKDAAGRERSILQSNHVTGDRYASEDILALVRSKMAEGVPLPATLRVPAPATGAGKRAWDRYNRWLFHHAGLWEDVYGREPFFREKYWENVLDLAHMMIPGERAKMAEMAARQGSPKVAKRLTQIVGDGAFTRKEIGDVASTRTGRAISEVAYDAANRREWAYAFRLLSPYVQASVNGMYRWSKALVQNPESTYRILRAGNFLVGEDSAAINDYLGTDLPEGTPFIYTDPQTNQAKFALPLVGKIAHALLRLPDNVSTPFSISAGQMNLAFPNYEQAQDTRGASNFSVVAKTLWPGLGPMATIPLEWMGAGRNDWVRDYLFPYGGTEGGWESQMRRNLIPPVWGRVLDLISPSPTTTEKRGTKMVQFAVSLAESEGGFASMSPAQQASIWERAKHLAWALDVVEAMAAPFSPSAPNPDIVYTDVASQPEHYIYAKQMSQMYRKYLEGTDYNYDLAEAQFVRDFGLDAIMLTAPSGQNSDTAPPTFNASALHKVYPKGYDKYGPVLRYILTDPSGSDIDLGLYTRQFGAGERKVPSLQERQDSATQTIFLYVYKHQMELINSSTLSDYQRTIAQNDLQDQLASQGWTNESFWRSKEQRQVTADMMLAATRDPQMVPFIGSTASVYLRGYLLQRNQMIDQLQAKGMSGDLASATVSGADQRSALFGLGETMALKDNRFAVIWRLGLRSEVSPEVK